MFVCIHLCWEVRSPRPTGEPGPIGTECGPIGEVLFQIGKSKANFESNVNPCPPL